MGSGASSKKKLGPDIGGQPSVVQDVSTTSIVSRTSNDETLQAYRERPRSDTSRPSVGSVVAEPRARRVFVRAHSAPKIYPTPLEQSVKNSFTSTATMEKLQPGITDWCNAPVSGAESTPDALGQDSVSMPDVAELFCKQVVREALEKSETETPDTQRELSRLEDIESLRREIFLLRSERASDNHQEAIERSQVYKQCVARLERELAAAREELDKVKTQCRRKVRQINIRLAECQQERSLRSFELCDVIGGLKEQNAALIDQLRDYEGNHTGSNTCTKRPGTSLDFREEGAGRTNLILELSTKVSEQDAEISRLKEEIRLKDDAIHCLELPCHKLTNHVCEYSGTHSSSKYSEVEKHQNLSQNMDGGLCNDGGSDVTNPMKLTCEAQNLKFLDGAGNSAPSSSPFSNFASDIADSNNSNRKKSQAEGLLDSPGDDFCSSQKLVSNEIYSNGDICGIGDECSFNWGDSQPNASGFKVKSTKNSATKGSSDQFIALEIQSRTEVKGPSAVLDISPTSKKSGFRKISAPKSRVVRTAQNDLVVVESKGNKKGGSKNVVEKPPNGKEIKYGPQSYVK